MNRLPLYSTRIRGIVTMNLSPSLSSDSCNDGSSLMARRIPEPRPRYFMIFELNETMRLFRTTAFPNLMFSIVRLYWLIYKKIRRMDAAKKQREKNQTAKSTIFAVFAFRWTEFSRTNKNYRDVIFVRYILSRYGTRTSPIASLRTESVAFASASRASLSSFDSALIIGHCW